MNQTVNPSQKNDSKPWYQEPWPWFLMIGPAIVVVAGFLTYYIAVTYKDDLVVDDYYLEGKNIELLLERDQLAMDQHMGAQIVMNDSNNQLRAFMKSDVPQNEDLTISFIHPTKGGLDQTIDLKLVDKNAQMYEAELHTLPKINNWLVVIENKDKTWRIQDKWIVSQGNAFDLTPAREAITEQK